MNTDKIEITDLQTKKIICFKEFVPPGMNHYYCPECGEELIVTENAKSMNLSGYCLRCKITWKNIER